MISGITQRYFVSRIFSTFLLFISLLFALYVLIDYTSRATNLGLSAEELGIYYLFTFIVRLDVLVPFALLTAVIQTITQANGRNELVAVRASGQSLPSALSPLLFLALLTTTSIYVNEQAAIPKALKWIEQMESKQTKRPVEGSTVSHLTLRDESELLFHSYSRSLKEFSDTYWLRNHNDIYRMQELNLRSDIPKARFVEHFQRDDQGRLVLIDQHVTLSLPHLKIDEAALMQSVTPPLEYSLTELWSQLPDKQQTRQPRDARIEAAFWKKATVPWLCLIALLAPVPFCVPYRKPLRIFYIFAGGLFGLFTLYIALSAGYTLATHDVFPAWLALCLPTALIAAMSAVRFAKIK